MQKKWIDAIKKLSEMKLYLQRYQQVMQVPLNETCSCSLKSFTDSLCDQVNELWNEFSFSKPLVDGMLEEADEQNHELLSCVQLMYNCYDEINAIIQNHEDPGEWIRVIEGVSGAMLIVQPFVVQYSKHHKPI